MPYLCELSSGQMLYLSQSGTQTSVTLANIQPGQQQQSSSSFSTGTWTAPPEVFSTPMNVVVRLHTDGGDRHLQIQGGSISSTHDNLSVGDEQRISVRSIDQEPDFVRSSMNSTPMKMGDMSDMKMGDMKMGNMSKGEMRMGDMQMSMKPMEMRMGDMELKSGSSSSESSVSSSRSMASGQASESAKSAHPRRFCSQCGAPITSTDRFCASCGTRLDGSS